MHISLRLLPCLFYLLSSVCGQDFNLTILHTNDVHARFEETSAYGGPCTSRSCFGGLARRQTLIQEIRSTHRNVLLLDAGDQFQGTIWFNHYRGNATKYFMERLGYDVMALGNHEFDEGISGLANFLRGFSVPVVCANLYSDNVPALQGLYASSHVIELNGRDIGVIGYVTDKTPELVLPDGIKGLVFEEVIESVRREAQKLSSRGIDIIIALGHAGFSVDLEIAKRVTQVDLVVGGHSNTFLYSGEAPSTEKPSGPYPYKITRDDGSVVPVVQDFTAGKYLGYLNLNFDNTGKVTGWNGNPILADESVEKEADILQMVKEWKKPLENLGEETIGRTLVLLDGNRVTCRKKECNMGNMAVDALVRFCLARLPASQGWARAAIGLWNSGGIRSSFQKGDITIKSVMDAFPFRNTLEVVQLSGKTILEVLENSVQEYDSGDPPGRFLQVSGVRVVYNLMKEPGNRVETVKVLCSSCDIPDYFPLDLEESYLVVTNNYMVQGGDGYSMIKENMQQYLPLGNLLVDGVLEFINKTSPLTNGLEGRIIFTEETGINPVKPVCENSGNPLKNSLLFEILFFTIISYKLS